MATKSATIGASKFRLVGSLLISTDRMTQAEGLEEARGLKGHHMASDREIDTLERTCTEVKRLTDCSLVVTSTTGLQHDGPFERTQNGERRRLSNKSPDKLSREESDQIGREFNALKEQEKGWEYSGENPVFVYHRGRALSFDAACWPPGERGFVILVQDSGEVNDQHSIAAKLR